MAALQSFLGATGDLVSLSPGNSSHDLAARHLALVTHAFGVAFRAHWGGNQTMAPEFQKPSWVGRAFLAKEERVRLEEIHLRLRLAVESLVLHTADGSAKETFGRISDLVEEPLGSPYYGALWRAFTDPRLHASEDIQLFELSDPGAKLEFERSFRLAYAESVATPEGADFARGVLEFQKDRPRLLRELSICRPVFWRRSSSVAHPYTSHPSTARTFLALTLPVPSAMRQT
jgi:hypothetical protein